MPLSNLTEVYTKTQPSSYEANTTTETQPEALQLTSILHVRTYNSIFATDITYQTIKLQRGRKLTGLKQYPSWLANDMTVHS